MVVELRDPTTLRRGTQIFKYLYNCENDEKRKLVNSYDQTYQHILRP